MKSRTPSVTLRLALWLISLALFGFIMPPALRAQVRITGQIKNGTTQQPVAGEKVQLLSPRGGMQQVAEVTADSSGHYTIEQNDIDPKGFYLAQAIYQGVPFHTPVQFDPLGNAPSTDITVYEVTNAVPNIRIHLYRELVAAQGSKARVQEQFLIENPSQPPREFANAKSTFRFRLPSQVGAPNVTVTGLMDMPLPQTPEPGKSPGEYSIHYPLKPGITTVTVDYQTDYDPAQFLLKSETSFPIAHGELYVFPASLRVDSMTFKPAAVDSQHNVQELVAENIPADKAIEANLSGDSATATAAPEDNQQNEQVKEVPDSMTKLGVPLLSAFLLILFWALGIRMSKEWPRLKERMTALPVQHQYEAQAEELFNALADLDELFASGKIEKKQYWKERLELKAKLMAILKKGSPSLLETYATRRLPH